MEFGKLLAIEGSHPLLNGRELPTVRLRTAPLAAAEDFVSITRRPRSSLLLVALLAGCSKDSPPSGSPLDPPESELEADVQRAVAAAIFEEDDSKRYDEIRRILDGIAASRFVIAQDYVNLACLDMAKLTPKESSRADFWLEKAAAKDPNLATLHYCLGLRARERIDFK